MRKSEYVWKPLDLGPGMRLYRVRVIFDNLPELIEIHIVVASKPSHAARVIDAIYKEGTAKYRVDARALNVYQPKALYDAEITLKFADETETV